ncbi:macro domain-containing protein, partial [Cystoisospora suis]
MSSALSVGAEAVSNAFQWISTEIRKTLEEDEDFSILFSKPPRLTGDESYDAYGERGRNSRSSYYGDGGDHGVYVHRREGVHTPPKTSISLDCLTSWQDSLEEEEGGGCYSSSSSFSPLPSSSSSPTLRKPLASKTSSSSHLRLSRKCSTSTTASSIHTNRNSPPFLHCNYTKEEEKLRSSSSSSSFSTGCISPPDGLTPPTSTLLFMKEEEEDLLLSSPRKTSPSSPFPVDVDLNHKLYVFRGDPCCLKVDALVCFTNENFSSADDLGRRLRAIGEEALLDEIRNLERCKAGEARICRSFNLPSSRIIYTVGPKFNNKYITATHNALNACIRESLLLLDEHGLTTVALPFFIPKSPSSKLSSSNRRIYGNARVPPSSSSSNYMRPSQCMRDLQG